MKLDGIVLGGMAEAQDRADKLALQQRGLDQQDRALGMQERQMLSQEQAAQVKLAEERLGATLTQIGQLFKSVQTPEDRQKIAGTVKSLGQQAAIFAVASGRDPTGILQRIETEMNLLRTPEEQALIAGAAKGAEALAAAPGTSQAKGMESAAEAAARLAAETSPAAIQAAANKAGAVAQATAAGTAKGTPAKAQTDAGKIVQDRDLFVRQYGEDSPQVRAFDEAAAPAAGLSDVAGVRKEYVNNSKDFVTIRDSFGKMAAAIQNPTAAGDLAAIFSFMKILDPGSVVREQEFANAQNAAGVPDRVRNLYNRLLEGERLNDNQRADFKNQAQALFTTQLKNQLQAEQQYRDIATRNKMRPEDVVIDLIGDYRRALPASPAQNPENDPLGIRGGK